MMRPGALLSVLGLLLGGCSVLDLSVPVPSLDQPSEMAPPYRKVIATRIGYVVGDPAKAGIMQISPARRISYLPGQSWLVCLKTNAQTEPRHYAVFFRGEQLSDSRIAVAIDDCEKQAYDPFNWVEEGRKPN